MIIVATNSLAGRPPGPGAGLPAEGWGAVPPGMGRIYVHVFCFGDSFFHGGPRLVVCWGSLVGLAVPRPPAATATSCCVRVCVVWLVCWLISYKGAPSSPLLLLRQQPTNQEGRDRATASFVARRQQRRRAEWQEEASGSGALVGGDHASCGAAARSTTVYSDENLLIALNQHVFL